MSSVVSFTTGAGTFPVHAEYTHDEVLARYEESLRLLVDVFNKDTNTDTITVQDYEDVIQAIADLQNLLEDGVLVGSKQYFLTLEMARNIELLQRSLMAIDLVAPNATDAQKIDSIMRWRDLSDIGLSRIMQSSVNALSANTSLQALIELEYVRVGNEQIFASLNELQQASIATKDALDLLERIQGLHNMIAPPSDRITDAVSQRLSAWEEGTAHGNLCTVESVVGQFQSDFDPVFSDPLFPAVDIDPLTPGFQGLTADVRNEYNNAIDDLRKLINELDTVNGTFPGGPNEAERAGTLAERLENVLTDMGDGSDTAIQTWILDGYNQRDTATGGNFQRRLTDAITTAQSVNDQQRQELRRELFVFEEFYRSASAMLNNINRIIERMASNISR